MEVVLVILFDGGGGLKIFDTGVLFINLEGISSALRLSS